MKSHYFIFGIVVLIAFCGFVFTQQTRTTGLVAPGVSLSSFNPMMADANPIEWYKVECIHHIVDFFKIDKFVYPQNNKCAGVIEETCDTLKKMKTSKLETFGTTKQDAYKIMIFEVAGNLLGKITLTKGFETPDYVKMNIKLDKTIITIKGWDETMEMNIELEGKKSGNQIFWESGKLKVEDFSCEFGG